ncbi:2'-5' RNA ligase family protein [Kineococcus gynurae]|uniref:2'-5' RNA ligase family protein n=1 Tax=Kineococcus gynurae TaxID=452979 RepID=A0ABV5LT37_9ACTN
MTSAGPVDDDGDTGDSGDTGEADDPLVGVIIEIPQPYAIELTAWRAEFGDPLARSVPPHITLLPPTRLARDGFDPLVAHLRTVAAAREPFEVLLRGTATFRPVSPVVFVQLAHGISECEMLQAAVRSGPVSRDLDFPYHPHVTVAHDVAASALDRAETALRDWEGRFTVGGFSLHEHGADGVWRLHERFAFRTG